MILKATRQQTKEHNRNLVLKTIFEHDQHQPGRDRPHSPA